MQGLLPASQLQSELLAFRYGAVEREDSLQPSLRPIPPIRHPLTLLGPPKNTLSGNAVLPDAVSGIDIVVKLDIE